MPGDAGSSKRSSSFEPVVNQGFLLSPKPYHDMPERFHEKFWKFGEHLMSLQRYAVFTHGALRQHLAKVSAVGSDSEQYLEDMYEQQQLTMSRITAAVGEHTMTQDHAGVLFKAMAALDKLLDEPAEMVTEAHWDY